MRAALISLLIVLVYATIGLLLGWINLFTRGTPERDLPIHFFTWMVAWPLMLVIAFVSYCASIMESSIDSLNWKVARLFKRKLHSDEFGTLYSSPSPWGEMLFVRVEDSTGRYDIPVPPGIRTAKGAVAWTYYTSEEAFDPVRV